MSLGKFLCAEFIILLVFTMVCAGQGADIKTVPMKRVSASSGEGMYINYCAVCHGKDGTGNGPAAPALRTAPTDLTKLAEKNNGKFPGVQVYEAIRGDTNMPAAHGTKDMPVWSSLFRQSCRGSTGTVESEVHLRISNLTSYVESLNKK